MLNSNVQFASVYRALQASRYRVLFLVLPVALLLFLLLLVAGRHFGEVIQERKEGYTAALSLPESAVLREEIARLNQQKQELFARFFAASNESLLKFQAQQWIDENLATGLPQDSQITFFQPTAAELPDLRVLVLPVKISCIEVPDNLLVLLHAVERSGKFVVIRELAVGVRQQSVFEAHDFSMSLSFYFLLEE